LRGFTLGKEATDVKSKNMSKAQKVFLYLKEKILDNEMPPGEFINLNKVAQELSVSKIPVREGVKKLENIGLVESIPNVGVRVKSLNLHELEQFVLIRRELEALAARLAAETIDKKSIKKLKEYADKMEEYRLSDNIHEYIITNREFHCLLYKCSNSPILNNMVIDLWDRSERTRWVFSMFPERLAKSNHEHYELIKALEAHDAQTAGDIIYRQKSSGFISVIKVLKEISPQAQ
jgi:DNA-binding GntR family transcriptional regulator